jgi:hypothetical protein
LLLSGLILMAYSLHCLGGNAQFQLFISSLLIFQNFILWQKTKIKAHLTAQDNRIKVTKAEAASKVTKVVLSQIAASARMMTICNKMCQQADNSLDKNNSVAASKVALSARATTLLV